MKKGYQYYADIVFEQVVYDPSVNETDDDEVIEYAEEIAELLVLDKEKLRNEVRDMMEIQQMVQF